MQALMRAHLGAVCKGAACSHALRLSLKNSNSDIIAGFSPQACWERTCSAYQCPLTFKLKDNAHETVDQSAEACCGKTCGSFRWPTGYHKKCSSIAGSSVDVCWGATGGVIACPYGSKKIADGASEKDVSTESYCKPTCDSITCSANQVKKKEAEKEKAEPCESIYCEKTCESFSCPDGCTSKAGAASLREPSKTNAVSHRASPSPVPGGSSRSLLSLRQMAFPRKLAATRPAPHVQKPVAGSSNARMAFCSERMLVL